MTSAIDLYARAQVARSAAWDCLIVARTPADQAAARALYERTHSLVIAAAAALGAERRLLREASDRRPSAVHPVAIGAAGPLARPGGVTNPGAPLSGTVSGASISSSEES